MSNLLRNNQLSAYTIMGLPEGGPFILIVFIMDPFLQLATDLLDGCCETPRVIIEKVLIDQQSIKT